MGKFCTLGHASRRRGLLGLWSQRCPYFPVVQEWGLVGAWGEGAVRAPLGRGGQLLGFRLELGIPGSLGRGLQGGELLFLASSQGS